MVWIVGSSTRSGPDARAARLAAHASARPDTNPPPESSMKSIAAVLQLNAPVTTAAIGELECDQTRCVVDQALRLRSWSRVSAPASRPVIAVTATASVGEIDRAERRMRPRGAAPERASAPDTPPPPRSAAPGRRRAAAPGAGPRAGRAWNDPAVGEQQRRNEQQEEDLGRDAAASRDGHEGQPDAGQRPAAAAADRDPLVDRAHHGDREQQPQRDLDDAHAANCHAARSVDFSLRKRDPASAARKAISSGVDSRPRIALRCGKRPKSRMTRRVALGPRGAARHRPVSSRRRVNIASERCRAVRILGVRRTADAGTSAPPGSSGRSSPRRDGFGDDGERQRIAGEGARAVAKAVPGELVEQQHACQRAPAAPSSRRNRQRAVSTAAAEAASAYFRVERLILAKPIAAGPTVLPRCPAARPRSRGRNAAVTDMCHSHDALPMTDIVPRCRQCNLLLGLRCALASCFDAHVLPRHLFCSPAARRCCWSTTPG